MMTDEEMDDDPHLRTTDDPKSSPKILDPPPPGLRTEPESHSSLRTRPESQSSGIRS
jgi:hypothetical protein